MKIIWLRDNEERFIDDFIIAHTSTQEDVQECINDLANIKPHYTWQDILDCLPNDCIVYDRWTNTDEVFY